MNIPRTIESFYPVMSGPANQAYRISAELEKQGIRSPILTSNTGAEKRPLRERMNGVSVQRFPVKAKFMKYFITPYLKRHLEDADFDLICGHSYRSYQTEIAYKTAKRKGKPFVLHNHGSLLGYRSFVQGWRRLPYAVYDILHKNIALDADAIVVNTKQELEEVLHFGVDKNKVHIIPVGINTDEFKPANKRRKEVRLLFLGRIARDRNVGPVIKAVKLLVDKGINVKLSVVGGPVKRSDTEQGDYIDEMKKLVKRLGLTDRVIFTGPMYGTKRNLIYRTSDIFVYPSLWENFGQTILEAAAAGLPLICSKVGVALDLIKPGVTGRFVGFDDPKGIANAVLEFGNKEKRQKAEKELIKQVKRDFNWEKITESYIKLYKSL